MAFCRLIQSKSSTQIHRLRFSSKAVSLCSSMCSYTDSEKPPQLKKDPVAEDEREMTVEPLLKDSRFTEAKPGLFSKETFIRNERVDSRCNLKDVVHILKDKVTGTNQQQNYQISDASTPSVDSTASMVIASRNLSDQGSGELQDSKPIAKLQNALTINNKNMSVNHGTFGISGDTSSDVVVNAKTSEASQMLNFLLPHESKDDDAFKTQSMPTIIASQNSWENYEEETETNNSKLADQETGSMRSDEALSTPFLDLDEGLVTNSEHSSPVLPQTVVEESKVEEGIDAHSSNLTECRLVKQNKMVTSNKILDLGSEGGAVSTICNGSKKAVRLADLFRKQGDNQRSTVARNEGIEPEESLSNWILGIAKNTELELQHLSPSDNFLPGEVSVDLEDANLKASPLSGYKKHLGDGENVRFEGGEVSFPSNETHKIIDSKNCDMKSVSDQIAEQVVKPKSLTSTHQSFEHSNEPCKEEAAKIFDIKHLFDIIKVQDDVTNDNNNTGLVAKKDTSNADLQRFDHNDRLTSLDFTATELKVESEETGDLDFQSVGCMDFKTSIDIPFPTKDTTQKKLNNTYFSGKELNENKVLVRFLPNIVSELDVLRNFERCGEILKVEIPDVEGPWFKIAYIYFKTREGLQNALKVSDKTVKSGFVTIEPTTLIEKMAAKVPFPSLICDPDVPAALIKNPSRTVKIQKLSCGISSHQILEAMAFCESNVSGYFLDSSNSVAFVEFETEIGKEMALAKHYIDVLGRQLPVLRIDAPRTTVVRISNIESLSMKSVVQACKSMGDIRLFRPRCPGILDLHFRPAEWPNMWNILNRLNELEMEGRRLQAEPAPVFPPEILLSLWQQPEGRKYLKTTALTLLKKLGKTAIDTSELVSLENILLDKI